MAASSLWHHMERTHGKLLTQARGVNIEGGVLEVYKVSFPRILKLVDFLVGKCPAKAKKPGRLRVHFMFRHWKLEVAIFQEGTEPLPRCDQCGMHMQTDRIFKKRQSNKCHKWMERQLRRRDVEMAAICGGTEFNLDREEGEERVENVPTFRYLGLPLYQTDDDWLAVRQKIMRARSAWGRLGKLLWREGQIPRRRKVSTGWWFWRFYCMGRKRGSFWRKRKIG